MITINKSSIEDMKILAGAAVKSSELYFEAINGAPTARLVNDNFCVEVEFDGCVEVGQRELVTAAAFKQLVKNADGDLTFEGLSEPQERSKDERFEISKMSASNFCDAGAKLLPFASNDKLRPYLAGMMFSRDGSEFIATDTYVMGIKRYGTLRPEYNDEWHSGIVSIPTATAKFWQRILKKNKAETFELGFPVGNTLKRRPFVKFGKWKAWSTEMIPAVKYWLILKEDSAFSEYDLRQAKDMLEKNIGETDRNLKMIDREDSSVYANIGHLKYFVLFDRSVCKPLVSHFRCDVPIQDIVSYDRSRIKKIFDLLSDENVRMCCDADAPFMACFKCGTEQNNTEAAIISSHLKCSDIESYFRVTSSLTNK